MKLQRKGKGRWCLSNGKLVAIGQSIEGVARRARRIGIINDDQWSALLRDGRGIYDRNGGDAA